MKTESRLPDAVVINNRMTIAFERQAYREGLITSPRTPPGLFLETPPADDHLNLELSLGALVLFGKLYLDAQADIGKSMCFRAGAASEEVLINYTRLWDLGVVGFNESGALVKDSASGEIAFGQRSLLLDHDSLTAYAPLIEDHIAVNGDPSDVKLFHKALPLLLALTRGLQPDDLSDEKQFDLITGKMISSHPDLYYILDGYIYEFFRILRTSQRYNCPVQSNCNRISIKDEKLLPSSQTSARLYQVIVEEQCTFPFPRTIASALKLCNDKRIKNFREQLFWWSKLVLEGSADESKIRIEIRKAKKDLEKLDTYKRAGRILAFLSIPVAVASVLSGLPLGLTLLPVGPFMTIDSMRRERQHAWLMFGKP